MCPYCEPAFGFIVECNGHLNCFRKKEAKIKNVESIYLVSMNGGMEWLRPFWDFLAKRNQSHLSPTNNIFSQQIRGSKCFLVLKRPDGSESQRFWWNENIVSEIGRVSQLSDLGRGFEFEGFSRMKSNSFIEIGDSVDIIRMEDFSCWEFLRKVILVIRRLFERDFWISTRRTTLSN
jgi:hypothetical protein